VAFTARRATWRVLAALLTATVTLVAGCAVVTARAVYQDQHASGGNTFSAGDFLSYSEEVLADGPLFYHRLAEGSGTTSMADSSGNNRTGTYTSTTSTTTNYLVPGRYAGESGSYFSGTGNYVTTQTAAAAPTTFSIEAWFLTGASSSVGGKVIGFGNARVGSSGSPDRHIYVDNLGRLTFGVFFNNFYYTVRSSSAVNNSAWHHVVGTYGSGTLRLYVDGMLQQQRTDVQGSFTFPSGSYVRVGGDGWNCSWPNVPGCPFAPASGYLNGFIDEPAVYTSVLSQTRVSAHFNAGSAAAYASAVQADSPYLYWRFGETGPQLAADSSGNNRDGFYYLGPDVLVGQNGAVPSNSSAILSAIGTSGAARNPTQYTNPNPFTIEGWFRTQTTAGGKLIGFGNQPFGTSTSYDRHIYMRDDGRLVFGTYLSSTGTRTLTTTAAYNDGAWHHVAASLGSGGMQLYVDGELALENAAVTTAESTTGYWRIGGDNLNGWPDPPTSYYFAGWLDEWAVYGAQLSAGRIAVHYYSRNR
jgi:hypothetical protein